MSGSRPLALAGLVLVVVALVGGAFWTARELPPMASSGPSSQAARVTSPQGTALASVSASAGIEPPGYLVVFDFLPGIAADVEAGSLAGNPDAAELVRFIGEPASFGSTVVDRVQADVDAPSRCGTVDRPSMEGITAALNVGLPVDQRIDLSSPASRALLRWDAAEGFVSLRIFVQDVRSHMTCADAGVRF